MLKRGGYADLKRGYVDILRSDQKLPGVLLAKDSAEQDKQMTEPK